MAAHDTYPITGVPLKKPPPPNGAVPLRKNVNDWYRSKDEQDVIQVKLFLLALIKFEGLDVNDKLSFFQVAGIHGYPDVAWDGEPKKPMCPEDKNLEGFCTHNSVLFPSWHRPYLMLYEQRLYELMVKDGDGIIAKHTAGASSDVQSAWKEAARTWRLPYWDWASRKDTPGIPDIAMHPTIKIDTPAFPHEPPYPNPMFKFSMPKGETMGKHGVPAVLDPHGLPIPYQDCIGTSRWPKAYKGHDWRDGDVNNHLVKIALIAAQWPQKKMPHMTIADAVYRLFTEKWFIRYEAFATTHLYNLEKEKNPNADVTHYLSLEGIHNMIHNWIGGVGLEGHMTEVPVSAFDPIFWLHHCNIDRLYAMWQDLHEELWWDEKSPLAGDGLPSTFLKPFHDDKNFGKWNSNKARYWRESCGYSYPELQPWLPEYQKGDGSIDKERYLISLTNAINALYGTTRALALKPPNGIKPPTPTVEGAHVYNDYVAIASYEKFALGGAPFTIHILMGPERSEHSGFYSNEIGLIFNFTAQLPGEDGSGCANCAVQATRGAKATGLLPLTPSLINLSATSEGEDKFDVLNAEETLTWLKKHLRFQATSIGGKEVDIPSLEVKVANGSSQHYHDTNVFSSFAGYQKQFDVPKRDSGAAQLAVST